MTDRSYPTSESQMPDEDEVTRREAPSATGQHGITVACPRVSDYSVEPESGKEMFHGEVREAAPAEPWHSRLHNLVSFVLRAYVAPEYGVDTDLLTRQASLHNFASDTSIRKSGIDPATGDRYLEELAFEIKSTQSTEELEQRTRIMAARGVHRIFAIPVRGDDAGSELIAGPVAEWMPTEERWLTYGDGEAIADPCLFEPVPVRALLDANEADDAVAQALLHKGNPFLVRHTTETHEKGRKEGEGRFMRKLLVQRFGPLPEDVVTRIQQADSATLERWVERILSASTLDEVFEAWGETAPCDAAAALLRQALADARS